MGFVDLFMSCYCQKNNDNHNLNQTLKEIECIFYDIVEKYTETEWSDIFALSINV